MFTVSKAKHKPYIHGRAIIDRVKKNAVEIGAAGAFTVTYKNAIVCSKPAFEFCGMEHGNFIVSEIETLSSLDFVG